MKPDVLIPTVLPRQQLKSLVKEIDDTTEYNKLILSCKDTSAPLNRNWCFNESESDIVIYCDDDLTEFGQNWADELIKPLLEDENIGIISARLLKMDGSKGVMQDWGVTMDFNKPIVRKHLVPGACIAMRRIDLQNIVECKEYEFNIPWDSNYKRASYEDSDICEVFKRYLGKNICVNNRCLIKHKNAEKWRPNFDWRINKNYFNAKFNLGY